MRLTILRHGEASFEAASDDLRELTPRGKDDTRLVLERCKGDIDKRCLFLASPLVRAQQTAAIAADILGLKALKTCDLMTPEANITGLLDYLNQQQVEHIFMVSHQPLVGRMVNSLSGSEPNRHHMDTSSIACLEGDDILPSCMDLVFLKHRNSPH